MKFTNKNNFLFLFNLSFECTVFNLVLSYFAKPNFIIYDEWFDEDLEKTKLDVQNKKIKTISNIHEFFYEQSNYKVGASENNLQLEIKVNEKKILTNNYLENNSGKSTSVSSEKFRFFEKFTKSKLKFNITKKIIYSLSIFGVVLIFGLLIFFVQQSKKNESKITNNSFFIEKGL